MNAMVWQDLTTSFKVIHSQQGVRPFSEADNQLTKTEVRFSRLAHARSQALLKAPSWSVQELQQLDCTQALAPSYFAHPWHMDICSFVPGLQSLTLTSSPRDRPGKRTQSQNSTPDTLARHENGTLPTGTNHAASPRTPQVASSPEASVQSWQPDVNHTVAEMSAGTAPMCPTPPPPCPSVPRIPLVPAFISWRPCGCVHRPCRCPWGRRWGRGVGV